MRATTTRAARAIRRRLDMRRHRGSAVRCPICDGSWTAFKADWNRPDALCWRCGAHERHRAQWLLLQARPGLVRGPGRLLHFAPEFCLHGPLRRLASARGLDYETADLDPTGVDRALDLMGLDVPDGTFTAIVCSHVLEHVADDARALAELRRVLSPGGWCLLLFPLDLTRAHTYEDPAITTPAARLAAFWQSDHVRLYGRDAAGRLAAAGFDVEVIRPWEAFGAAAARRAGLLASDWMFLCR